jgi:hypothetical protein
MGNPEMRGAGVNEIPGYGTSDHFEHAIGTRWADGMAEDEGILYFFLLRYYRRLESSRVHADGERPEPQVISPGEYATVTDRLIEDCQDGHDRDTGDKMPSRLHNLPAARYDELTVVVGHWATIAFDQSFGDQLAIVRGTAA